MTPILSDLKTTRGDDPAGVHDLVSQTRMPAIGRERKKWPGVSITH